MNGRKSSQNSATSIPTGSGFLNLEAQALRAVDGDAAIAKIGVVKDAAGGAHQCILCELIAKIVSHILSK